MLTFPIEKTPVLKANPTDNKPYNLCQDSVSSQKTPTIEDQIEEYAQRNPEKLKSLEDSEEKHISSLPPKKQEKYKDRRWAGHSYGAKLIIHTAYLFQAYHFAYGVEGKPTKPSKKRLAKELRICIRTLDKALKILKDMGVISWKSGKKTWETNTYYLSDTYKSTPMRKPDDFRHPRHLWLKQQYLIKKQKLKEFTRTLYEHLLGDIADHLLRKNKNIRTSQERGSKNATNASKDPPKSRKVPPNWHLLKNLKLHFKDQWVLSRYSECLLRAAIDDLRAYEAWGKTVENIPAFLMCRCKEHEKQNGTKKQKAKPIDIKEWLTNYFKFHRNRFIFISKQNQVDPTTSESRPFIQLLWHNHDIRKSVLRVYRKVQGAWVDKVFNFNRPNLSGAIQAYLEN